MTLLQLLGSTVLLVTSAAQAPSPVRYSAAEFDHTHAAWTEVLEGALEGGLVDYAALRKAPAELDAYLHQLERTTPKQHKAWTREQRFAFWINAYNVYTIKLIRDEGPVDSIKDLGGFFSSPWEKKFIPLQAFDPERKNKKITLDEIEHELIRPVFEDARVHAAVNCASISCPPLRGEAYRADDLEEQLEDQVRVWLSDVTRNQVVPTKGKIRVSKIFDWYDKDFGKKDERVVRWIAGHVKDEVLAKTLRAGAKSIDVKYLSYDWDVNAQPGKK